MISNKFALSRFGRSVSFQSCFPEAKSADAKSPEDNDTRISIKCSYNELYNEDNISPHEVDCEISPASHSGKLSVPAVPPEITDLYPSISDSQNSNPSVQVLQIDSNLATVRQVGGSGTHVSLNQSTRQIDPGYPLMSESTDFEAADSFTNFPLATVPYSGGISGEIKGSGRRTYVVLYLAALKGDWEMAEDFLEFNPLALRARITRNSETALHIAAGARHTRFVEELVKLMKPEDLALQNKVGNTALCFAAASGIRQIAEVMVNKSKTLPSIRGSRGALPLYMAALLGHRDMVLYLYSVTEKEIMTEEDRIGLLIATITANLFVPGFKVMCDKKLMHTQAVELVKRLWDQVLLLDDSKIGELIRTPSRLLFTAAELGIVEFITVLIRSYPDLLWKVDDQSRSIFHVAVAHRQEKIFNLIYEIGALKDLIAASKNENNVNMLHLAGKLAPSNRLKTDSSAAL